ncbi:hypothetical protein [Staphylococcus gallinarum]|uniref:hypothetical protein n=1 Tax=Staphylococcus gallinarum TaxID=1293 RepID=UPI0030C04959
MKSKIEVIGNALTELKNLNIENIGDAFLIVRTTAGQSRTIRLDNIIQLEMKTLEEDK